MRVLLFDLGGVVMNWTGPREFRKLMDLDISLESARDQLVNSASVRAFEAGICSIEEFANSFTQEFDLKISVNEVPDLFASWAGEPYSGVLDVLISLKADYRLACLSNTNALHWDYLQEEIGLSEVFHHNYASHLIELAKPDPAILEFVLKDMAVAATDVLFFEDTIANIHSADALGFQTCLVDPEVGVLPSLKKLSLL